MTCASILEAFLQTCVRNPDKLCVLFEGQHYSYRQLYQAAEAWAALLRESGLQPGERVGLYLGNSIDFLAAYLAVHLCGAIVVLINTQYRQLELRHILNDAGAIICITDSEALPELERVRRALGSLRRVILVDVEPPDSAAMAGSDPAARLHQLPAADTTALLAYTSGTTGRSKGAMLSHGNLASNSAAVTSAWRWSADDVLLLTLPLFHIHGLGVGIHGTFLAGASVNLRRRFDAADVYDTLLVGGSTMFFGVPTMYNRLVSEARQRAERPQPIRLYVSGSAPLNPQTFAEVHELFGLPILERYGMTETIMNMTNPYDGERRPGTVGQPFPGQEARVVDVLNREPVPDGTPGEIQVRGPHVFQGYWQQPEATAEVFDGEGWFNTGDLGWRSTDGYFTISGRAKELIISGGYNVYPREVEEVLQMHPDVLETAVLGMPHPDLGEEVVAVVVRTQRQADSLVGGLDTENEEQRALANSLVESCREKLASYKKPRRVFFVQSLPRNALGKVQKHILKQQLMREIR